METPTTFHLREEAQKIVGANNGVPAEVTGEMTQVALESSDVDLDSLSQSEYDALFRNTKARLQYIINGVKNE